MRVKEIFFAFLVRTAKAVNNVGRNHFAEIPVDVKANGKLLIVALIELLVSRQKALSVQDLALQHTEVNAEVKAIERLDSQKVD